MRDERRARWSKLSREELINELEKQSDLASLLFAVGFSREGRHLIPLLIDGIKIIYGDDETLRKYREMKLNYGPDND